MKNYIKYGTTGLIVLSIIIFSTIVISYTMKNIVSPQETLRQPLNVIAIDNSDEGISIFENQQKMITENRSTKELIKNLALNSSKLDKKTVDFMTAKIIDILQNTSKRAEYQDKLNDSGDTYKRLYKELKNTFPNELDSNIDIFVAINKNPSLLNKMQDENLKRMLQDMYAEGYCFELKKSKGGKLDQEPFSNDLGNPTIVQKFYTYVWINFDSLASYTSPQMSQYLKLRNSFNQFNLKSVSLKNGVSYADVLTLDLLENTAVFLVGCEDFIIKYPDFNEIKKVHCMRQAILYNFFVYSTHPYGSEILVYNDFIRNSTRKYKGTQFGDLCSNYSVYYQKLLEETRKKLGNNFSMYNNFPTIPLEITNLFSEQVPECNVDKALKLLEKAIGKLPRNNSLEQVSPIFEMDGNIYILANIYGTVYEGSMESEKRLIKSYKINPTTGKIFVNARKQEMEDLIYSWKELN